MHINGYRPYLGLGLGIHVLSAVEVFQVNAVNASESTLEVSVNKRIGFLFRGGVERNKFRFGLEYSAIPKADIILPDDQLIGTVANTYLGMSIGLVIGGGKNAREL